MLDLAMHSDQYAYMRTARPPTAVISFHCPVPAPDVSSFATPVDTLQLTPREDSAFDFRPVLLCCLLCFACPLLAAFALIWLVHCCLDCLADSVLDTPVAFLPS